MIVVLGEGLTFKAHLVFVVLHDMLIFFVVRMPWVGGLSQVRKFLGKSSSRLGNFILCQGINIDIWKENQIKLKDNIAGISKSTSSTKK